MMEMDTAFFGVGNMNRTETEPVTRAEAMAELQQAIENAIKGIRDPEAMARAAERMDRGREELRQQFGEMNIAVELIREGRDEE
jgi:hypothetical protein